MTKTNLVSTAFSSNLEKTEDSSLNEKKSSETSKLNELLGK